MEQKSIAVIKQLLESDNITDTFINELRTDERKGIKKLIERYERKKQKELELEDRYKRMCWFEQKNYAKSHRFIAGMDEAGRGPLAGPVVAAAVILPEDFKLLGLNDSKQLNEATRNSFFSIIKEQAVSYGISIVDCKEIDRVNIYKATKLAMYRAIGELDPVPDHILIDAVNLDQLPCSSESITKGDQKSVSIAAASVLAKVTRDTYMRKLHNAYPEYDFASNMGYGTKHHLEMIREHGVTPYHRKSFGPVRQAVR
ncbi:ribonuclease HII [Virgibacillus siamensis]|uniref:ribonuclease HII n=1 Tax=Virgibacillus siamensis TaxID=480071 RepID=UPI0009846668|nr:ribonuclease HII [Virgibacillus siamensis]